MQLWFKVMNATIFLKLYRVVKREGLMSTIHLLYHYIKKSSLNILLSFIAIPITLFIMMIYPWKRIRLFMLSSDRIGHFAWSTETLLCMLENNKNNDFDLTLFYLVPGQSISNKQLYRMWKRHIKILPFAYLWAMVNYYLMCWGSQKYKNDPYKKYFEFGDGCDRWNLIGKIKKIRLHFTNREERKAERVLGQMGIAKNERYVCIIGRDSNYLKIHKPNADTSYHDYRNVDINHYKKAALYLAEKGYFVIRMGKHVKDPFQLNHPKIIDYANSRHRSDLMDIYLTAHCDYVISVGTGLDSVAQIFRKPILITNYPLSDRGIWPDWHLFITKKIIHVATGRQLKFSEIFNLFSSSDHRNVSEIANQHGLIFVENTSDEILEAVDEMENRVNGNWHDSVEDIELQNAFWGQYPDRFSDTVPQLSMPIFSYQEIKEDRTLRVASSFLKKNG
jgi:putative glycosyltransferase (TIGR04372 family)